MEPSEHDDPQAPPYPPTEPESPHAGEEVASTDIDTPERAEVPPAYEPPLPPEPAEPGVYWCEAEDPGIHPVLGQIVHGENDFTGLTHPDALVALAALVQEGVLRKGEGRRADDESSHEASDR